MVNKRAKIALWFVGIFILTLVVLSLYFVFASHDVSSDTSSVYEDATHLYNITINNTDAGQDANITQVNITLWVILIFLWIQMEQMLLM